MALVIDAEAGSNTANSYLTVADADSLADTFASDTSLLWLSLSEDDKARYLVSATRNIENAFRFIGIRTSVKQRLEWPRIEVPRDGIYWNGLLNPQYQYSVDMLDPYEIPDFLKEATFLFAVALTIQDTTKTDENSGIKRLKVDQVVEIEYRDQIPNNKSSIPNPVFLILRKYGRLLSDLNGPKTAGSMQITR